MTVTDFAKDRIAFGESDILLRPKHYQPPRHGTVYCHGSEGGGGGATAWMSIKTRWPAMTACSFGAPMLAGDIGGNSTWGNDTVVLRVHAAAGFVTGMAETLDDRVNLLAQSMGALGALAWARQNLAKVAKIILIIPVINLTDVRDNSSYQAAIDAAYGGTYSESANGAAHNPLTMAAAGAFADIPMQIWYGLSDSLCKREFAEQFAAYCPLAEMKPLDGGHTEEIQTLINPSEIRRFLGYPV
ncbi:alpha/beta fold hydrolase [Xanthomonas axonopodis pv. nakataecorchori]|uniref:alpha/beta fold hydrolase n=1 Tax=Xanthomonas axonopodis TaxID=53413 RepID=UPI003530DA21